MVRFRGKKIDAVTPDIVDIIRNYKVYLLTMYYDRELNYYSWSQGKLFESQRLSLTKIICISILTYIQNALNIMKRAGHNYTPNNCGPIALYLRNISDVMWQL